MKNGEENKKKKVKGQILFNVIASIGLVIILIVLATSTLDSYNKPGWALVAVLVYGLMVVIVNSILKPVDPNKQPANDTSVFIEKEPEQKVEEQVEDENEKLVPEINNDSTTATSETPTSLYPKNAKVIIVSATEDKLKKINKIGLIVLFILSALISIAICVELGSIAFFIVGIGVSAMVLVMILYIPMMITRYIYIEVNRSKIVAEKQEQIDIIKQEEIKEEEKNIEEAQKKFPSSKEGKEFLLKDYDKVVFDSSLDEALKNIIKRELEKLKIDKNLVSPEIEKTRDTVTIIYCVIMTITIAFFMAYHTHILGFVSLIVFITSMYIMLYRKNAFEDIIYKEITSRPDEKIENIVASVTSNFVPKEKKLFRKLCLIITAIILFILFSTPHMIFENTPQGYYVRYYTYGIIHNPSKITVPEKHNGKEVVGIRGDVFKNVLFVKYIELPETITEIRGGAFQGCMSLKRINIPKKVTEIHGDTFKNCYSLESIDLPEGLTRIGGSAFRNDSSLTSVIIPKTVQEIGSSAFRNTGLTTVCMSRGTYYNYRAFKETNANIYYYGEGCPGEK